MAPDPADTHAAASKIGQLLGEVIVHHAPWTAEINEKEKWRQTEMWLEGLEQHAAGQVGPFLQQVLANSDPPPEIRSLIEEAIAPGAQFSAVIEQIFVFGIVSQLLGASVAPFLQGVSNDLWTSAVKAGISVPVSPAIIATAAGRGLNLGDPPTVNVPSWAYDEAKKSGVSDADINLQASLIGLPPALQELFELFRRGVITIDDVKTGLKEGDFRDDWIDRTVQLAHGWLTPTDFIRAAVQEQMTYSDAQAWAGKTGLDTGTAVPVNTGSGPATPDMFGLAYSIAGRPPGPQEMAHMTRRGIIQESGTGADMTTFQQGIAESDIKTKWTDALFKLSEYYPPPSEVGTLLERGGIDKPTAEGLWQAAGVPANLVSAYEYIATQQHVGQEKLEAKSTILTAYFDQILDNQQATALLGDLGFSGTVASDMLAIVDFRRQIQAINSVVKRVGSLYESYKLTPVEAQNALLHLGIDQTQVTGIIGTWSTLRDEAIRLPTTAEIGLAVKYGTIDQQTGLDALAALGYQPRDAAIILSAHSGKAVTPLPAAGTTVTG